LKHQLYEKTLKDEEYKKEIEKLTSQLAFKDKELKEVSAMNTTTDVPSSSSPIHKNMSSSPTSVNGGNNKRHSKDQEQLQVSKKLKTEVDKENQILRASVSSLKDRLKRVKRALYVSLFISIFLVLTHIFL
jgi:hypothetical protein